MPRLGKRRASHRALRNGNLLRVPCERRRCPAAAHMPDCVQRRHDSGDTTMSHEFDIVVVGAGPAGLAAATAAAGMGRKVAVLDDNPHVGGQIWRAGAGKSAADRAREQAVAGLESSSAELFAGRQVVDASPGSLQAWVGAEQRLESFQFESLILATGARERFLPFPGWTLPGVFGAGGLQALVRGGYDVRGKRVVVSGTGPLLLAVAAHLKQDGAEIVA